MTSLPDLQQQFLSALYEPETREPSDIAPNQHFSAAQLFQIYRNNALTTLADALRAVYPVTRQLVGEEFFTHCAHRYIRQHPMRGGDIHDYGDNFPDFLQDFSPTNSLPYLPDTAQLEWAWHTAWHAAEATSLPVMALQSIPPEQLANLRFTLHPSTQLLSSPYPTGSIWLAHQENESLSSSISLDKGPEHLLIHRFKNTVFVHIIEESTSIFLSKTLKKHSFHDAYEAAATIDRGFELQNVLSTFISLGIFTGMELP